MVPSIRSRSIQTRLKRLSKESFTGFVKALWRARGYELHRDDEVLVLEKGTEKYTVWIHHVGRLSIQDPTPPTSPVDIVVTNTIRTPDRLPPGTPRIIDVGDLEAMLLYAIDRDIADRLADRFMSVSRLTSHRSTTDESNQTTAGVVVNGFIVVVLLSTVLFTAMALFPGSAVGGVSLESIAGVTGGTTAADNTSGTGTVQPTTQSTSGTDGKVSRDTTHAMGFEEYGDPLRAGSSTEAEDQSSFPVGLTAAGIEDADIIAENHARRIANRSYRIEIEYQEFRDREVQSTYVERIAVESSSRYVSTIDQTGERAFTPPVVAETAVFADGETVTPKDGENYNVPMAPGDPAGYYTDRIATYLRWYLSVEESAIVDLEYRDGEAHYIVALGPDSWPGRVNSSGFARIDCRGIVHYLRVKYRVPESETTAEITIRYVELGGVDVSPPAWYRNATRTPTATD